VGEVPEQQGGAAVVHGLQRAPGDESQIRRGQEARRAGHSQEAANGEGNRFFGADFQKFVESTAKLFESITSEQNAVCKKRIAIITGKTQQLREVLGDQEHLERMNALQTQENNHFLQKCQSFSTDMQQRMARIAKLRLSELASKKKLQEEMEKNAFLKFL